MSQWERIIEEDGIKVFRRPTAESDILCLAGEATIAAPLSRVASIVLNAENSVHWMDQLKEIRTLEVPTPDTCIRYFRINTPFGITNRDFVTLGTTSINAKAKTFSFLSKSIEYPGAPITNCVRGEVVKSLFELKAPKNAKETSVWIEFQSDPRGYIPKWVINHFQNSWALNTLKGLRREALKSGIPIDLHIERVFP